jgi:hypothetical protein
MRGTRLLIARRVLQGMLLQWKLQARERVEVARGEQLAMATTVEREALSTSSKREAMSLASAKQSRYVRLELYSILSIESPIHNRSQNPWLALHGARWCHQPSKIFSLNIQTQNPHLLLTTLPVERCSSPSQVQIGLNAGQNVGSGLMLGPQISLSCLEFLCW